MCRTILIILMIEAIPVYAVPVTMAMEGIVTGHVNEPMIESQIPLGSTFLGVLGYDTDEADYVMHDTDVSVYEFYGSAAFSVESNALLFSSQDIRVVVEHDPIFYQDSIRVYGLTYTDYIGRDWSITILLRNSDQHVLDNTNLPVAPLDMQDWTYSRIAITDVTEPPTPSNPLPAVEGYLTSITPEPASLAMLVIGGLMVVRRR